MTCCGRRQSCPPAAARTKSEITSMAAPDRPSALAAVLPAGRESTLTDLMDAIQRRQFNERLNRRAAPACPPLGPDRRQRRGPGEPRAYPGRED